jgi:hypothetical protein
VPVFYCGFARSFDLSGHGFLLRFFGCETRAQAVFDFARHDAIHEGWDLHTRHKAIRRHTTRRIGAAPEMRLRRCGEIRA